MAGVDLVVHCVTMSTIEADEVAGLRAAVAAGTGLAGWHGGIADAYRGTSDWLQLVGGQFAGHPGKHPDERTGEQSDNYVPHRIEMTAAAAEHPITAGLSRLRPGDRAVLGAGRRLRRRARHHHPGRPRLGAVAPARHLPGGVDARRGAQGRVFVCTPGHRVEVLDDTNVRTLVERGLLWASR